MAGTIIFQQDNPDGTRTIWYQDGTSITVGNAVDPVQRAQQAGRVSAAQTQALYEDPFYQQNVLAPMNRSVEQQAQDRATQLQNQAKQLKLQGRTTEANILYNKAQVELRKRELRQSNQQFYAGQQLSANLALGQMRGPGNAAQFIDSGRRLGSMGIQTGSLGQIAAGGTATGAFTPGASMKPTSMADRMSGMLGAPSQGAIDQRDFNDKNLAAQIYAKPGQLARGSLESLSPYERDYLGSYGEAQGFDDGAFTDAYKRAGIQQGRR